MCVCVCVLLTQHILLFEGDITSMVASALKIYQGISSSASPSQQQQQSLSAPDSARDHTSQQLSSSSSSDLLEGLQETLQDARDLKHSLSEEDKKLQ